MQFVDLESKPAQSSPQVASGQLASSEPVQADGVASTIKLPDWLAAAKHPKVCLFHILFKALALVSYILGRHILNHYVMTFIFTMILGAFDFWTVKNISGRILVGMRWWNDIQEDGSSNWCFECQADESAIDAKDRSIFWGALYACPLVWGILAIINFLSFSWDWLLLISMSMTFAVTNVIGYWRCSKDQKRQVSDWAKNQAVAAMVSSFMK